MTDVSKWTSVVQQLTEQTASGKLHWMEDATSKRSDATSPVYRTAVLGRPIVCYEYSYIDTSRGEPEAGAAVEFVDGISGEVKWRLPETTYNWALLDAIRYRVSGAADFLDQFLK